jgi:hypothetical protein
LPELIIMVSHWTLRHDPSCAMYDMGIINFCSFYNFWSKNVVKNKLVVYFNVTQSFCLFGNFRHCVVGSWQWKIFRICKFNLRFRWLICATVFCSLNI